MLISPKDEWRVFFLQAVSCTTVGKYHVNLVIQRLMEQLSQLVTAELSNMNGVSTLNYLNS